MKKIALFISIVSSLFCFILVGGLYWYGYFSTVSVREKPVGPYTMVYKVYIGSPTDVSPVLDEIHQTLIAGFHITKPVSFGLYYDDPKVTPQEQCRILVGCILTDEQEGDLHAISEKYTLATLPRGMAVVADFPYKNKLSLLFGMLKGYSALSDYVAEYQIPKKPVLELYESTRIRYVYSTAFDADFFDAYLTLNDNVRSLSLSK